MRQPLPFFIFQKHTVFVPLKLLYGECLILIEPHQQLYPLKCLVDECHVNANCMEVLAKRVNYMFTHVVPSAKQMIAYYKYRDRPNSIRAGVFDRDLSDPKLMILNPYAFKKFQREGITYEWMPPDEFLFMGGSSKIIPVENLIKKP